MRHLPDDVKRLLPLYVVIFMSFIGYSIEIPIFTTLILNPHDALGGMPPATPVKMLVFLVGISLGMYPLGQFFGAPILGALSDRFGRRKTLLVSLVLCVTGYTFITVAIYLRSYWLLVLFLFLTGLVEGNIAIAQGAIADVATTKNRCRYFGYIYVSSATGFVLGALLSSIFTNKNIAPWFGPETTFWLVTILILLTTIWTFFSFHETHHAKGKLKKLSFFGTVFNLFSVFRDQQLRFYYAVNFFFYLAIFGFFRTYAMYCVETYDVDIVMVSLIVTYVSIPIIVANLLFTRLVAKIGKPTSIAALFAFILGCCMLSIVVFRPFYTIWITLFLTAFSIGLTLTFIAAIISFLGDDSNQGLLMGYNQSIQSGAQSISALLGGALASVFIELPIIFFAIASMLAALILFLHSILKPSQV